MSIDALILVPFEPQTALAVMDAGSRMSLGAHYALPLLEAADELEDFIGYSLRTRMRGEDGTLDWFGEKIRLPVHRSTSAVVLASTLERAGLTWEAIDPGSQDIAYWRGALAKARAKNPKTVVLCTTFVMSGSWLRSLIAVIRTNLPHAKLLVGGYFYATNTKHFLSLDADVMCVGEGEARLPLIVRASIAGVGLEQIPGLYIRKPDGTLHFTGQTKPLVLNDVPPVDWSVATRMEPALNLEDDCVQYGFESQRGCVFKCQFCTYRTLALPNLMDPEIAIERIFSMPRLDRGWLVLYDATATFPKDRFERFMRLAIDRGGFPCPVDVCARVNDVTEETAALMAKAGVTSVFIGQESGDERMLRNIQKGTHVSAVRPAVNALGKHGIQIVMSFLMGFPGENTESITNTRNLIAHLNDGFEDRPVVQVYICLPFHVQDLAVAKHAHDSLKNVDSSYAYEEGCSSKRAAEECLETFIAMSHIPHAPPNEIVFSELGLRNDWMCFQKNKHQIFRWAKAIDRGVAIFLEKNLHGKPIDLAELNAVKERISSALPPMTKRPPLSEKIGRKISLAVNRRLQKEFLREAERGVGFATRALLAAMVYADQKSLARAFRAFRTGSYVVPSSAKSDVISSETQALADSLIQEALAAPSQWKKSSEFDRQFRKQLRVLNG